jgi:hypothetical protein
MAKLSTTARKALPSSAFAGPGRSYPVNDKPHARAAKSRASGAENAGRISPAQQSRIDAKADRVLGHTFKEHKQRSAPYA